MTVVEGWFAGKSYKGKVPDMLDLPEVVRPHLELNIAMNSKVTYYVYGYDIICGAGTVLLPQSNPLCCYSLCAGCCQSCARLLGKQIPVMK